MKNANLNLMDKIRRLAIPEFNKELFKKDKNSDWLIDDSPFKSGVYILSMEAFKELYNFSEDDNKLSKALNGVPLLVLTNGLISRTFTLSPNCATIFYERHYEGFGFGKGSIIRGIKPEAIVHINGQKNIIGGLKGQEEYAYFKPEWIINLKDIKGSWKLFDLDVSPIKERFPWKIKRHCSNKTWPPKGQHVIFKYKNKKYDDLQVNVHYEIYDGIPLISKWISVESKSYSKEPQENQKNRIIAGKSYRINSFIAEILAAVEVENTPQGSVNAFEKPNIYIETDYAFSAMSSKNTDKAVFWEVDPDYSTQVAYNSDLPLLLTCKPPIGPNYMLKPGEKFESFRVFELILDSFDRERNYLAQKRMYRIIAPWTTENPIFMHMTTADPKKVKAVIDQCAEVGFEMVILSFGSGLNMEWEYPEFYEEYKELFDYAHSKGIEIGGYSLFSSRSIDDENDVIDPATGLPNKHATFGKAPCLCSKWGVDYIRKIKKFFEQTGADFLEHDGPYPGDLCASKTHPGHDGLEDSQWMQWRAQTDLYKWCRSRGIYINAPDWYFLSGSNKTGIGYKEVNWSLPRERQIILARQNIYDGTWDKTPSMGWMFTPLTTYHRVGEWKKSTLEPLEKHLKFFSAHLKQNFLSGVQSCYRGKRLFDSEITKSEIIKWVLLFKKHREILEADIIHLRRPDGVHIDGILHVNPHPKTNNECGFAVFYNPTKKIIKEKISIPLYYTGLTEYCWASIEDKEERKYKIDRDYKIHINVEIKPEDLTWVIIKSEQ